MFEDLIIDIKPIGWVESEFKIGDNKKNLGIIYIFNEYKKGLYRLNEFKKITIVFYFHHRQDYSLLVIPPHNNPGKEEFGIFATHSPKRPNHIGISTVSVLEIGENFIKIDNCDMISFTPILDIKANSK